MITPRISRSTRVPMSETRIDPAHPSLFEKKNMCGALYPAGGHRIRDPHNAPVAER